MNPHPDPLYAEFVARQGPLLEAFAGANHDLLTVRQANPVAWAVVLHCKGLLREAGGNIIDGERFEAGIYFPPDHLRRWDPGTVTMLTPRVWHPNILGPAVCLGSMRPAMSITDILTQLVEILTYQNFATHDGLNPAACQWARNHRERFPLERRPIHIPSPVSA